MRSFVIFVGAILSLQLYASLKNPAQELMSFETVITSEIEKTASKCVAHSRFEERLQCIFTSYFPLTTFDWEESHDKLHSLVALKLFGLRSKEITMFPDQSWALSWFLGESDNPNAPMPFTNPKEKKEIPTVSPFDYSALHCTKDKEMKTSHKITMCTQKKLKAVLETFQLSRGKREVYFNISRDIRRYFTPEQLNSINTDSPYSCSNYIQLFPKLAKSCFNSQDHNTYSLCIETLIAQLMELQVYCPEASKQLRQGFDAKLNHHYPCEKISFLVPDEDEIMLDLSQIDKALCRRHLDMANKNQMACLNIAGKGQRINCMEKELLRINSDKYYKRFEFAFENLYEFIEFEEIKRYKTTSLPLISEKNKLK